MPPDNETIFYPHTHKECKFYNRCNNSIVEVIRLQTGDRRERDMHESEIAIIHSGRLSMSYRECHNKSVNTANLMLIPPGATLYMVAEEETTLMIFRLKMAITRLCETVSIEHLGHMGIEIPNECGIIHANSHIQSFCAAIIECVNSGFRCAKYLESKLSELLMLLKAFYSWEDLVRLFAPLLSDDYTFKSFVMRNFKTAKTLEELARMANYSLSGFTKQFKKVIGHSPAAWIKEEKAKLIIHDLQCTNKSLTDISEDYGFSSVSHLSKFCSHYLGAPPGALRKADSHKIHS